MKVSFTTIVLNELDNLKALLPKIVKYVDEIVIVDTGSDDGTVEFLEKGGATVLKGNLDDGFAHARNLGLSKCTGTWVFSLDADERPTVGMMDWIKENSNRRISAFAFRRVTTLNGELMADERMIRMFRRTAGKWVGNIHEFVVTTGKTHECPDTLFIRHDKTSAVQMEQNRRYLKFYPKLNLGSGGRPMPTDEGWINFDLNPDAPDAVQVDVFEELPGPLPAKRILASHILEHITYHKTSQVLAMWIEKLAPGGTIEIRVPDAGAIMRAYVEGSIDYLKLLGGMYGGQTTELDFHHIAIDEPWLTGQLHWNKLQNIRRLPGTQPYELVMVARKPL